MRSAMLPILALAAFGLLAASDAPPPGALVPSVAASAPDDARDLGALAGCSPAAPYVTQWSTEQPLAWHCGQLEGRTADVARTLASALPLDAATTAHVRAIHARGVAQHRRPDVFGLVGDSTTLEPQFMTPFSAGAPSPVVLGDAVRAALLLPPREDGRALTVIDFFRAGHAYGPLDSFGAPRAAKTGARATWALAIDPQTGVTPLDAMIRALSPAYAIVLFGINDADFVLEPLDAIALRFGRSLRALATALEARGVIPILTTVPKHMRAWGLPDCGPLEARTNARLMVQTNVASATVAAVAAEGHLPLIDLRDALDPLVNHGIATDGVHPTFYPKRLGGGGVLDEAGLQCGYNARNLATLRMLTLVKRAIEKP